MIMYSFKVHINCETDLLSFLSTQVKTTNFT